MQSLPKRLGSRTATALQGAVKSSLPNPVGFLMANLSGNETIGLGGSAGLLLIVVRSADMNNLLSL